MVSIQMLTRGNKGNSGAMRNELAWRSSSFCESGACVQVALADHHVAVRDSKDPDGPILWFTAGEWKNFLEALRANDFHG